MCPTRTEVLVNTYNKYKYDVIYHQFTNNMCEANKYIENGAYQKHLYNKKNLLNDWFVVKSSR